MSSSNLESVVRKQLKKVFDKDIDQAAGLLHLHFHHSMIALFRSKAEDTDLGKSSRFRLSGSKLYPISMAKLPQEIMVDILLRLPVKPLGRFRCVCKSWHTSLTDPHFIKMHLNRATQNDNLSLILSSDDGLFSVNCEAFDEAKALDLPPIQLGPRIIVVGSCNGLICLSDYEGRASVYNPTTREYVKLPYTPIELPFGEFENYHLFSAMVFGYVPSTEELKVVRIATFEEPDGESCQCEMKVHTVGTESWRRIVNVPPHLCRGIDDALVNGAIHWRASREGGRFKFIISFDIGDEQFTEFPWPNSCFDNANNLVTLKAFGGRLSIFCHLNNGDVEVWAMDDYGLTGSWSRVFHFKGVEIVGNLGWPRPNFKVLCPLHIWKNGKILLEVVSRRLVIYDPTNKMVRDLCIHGIPDLFATNVYVESLTSIASLMAGNGVEGETQNLVVWMKPILVVFVAGVFANLHYE
ncbi:hypothetical protein HHK36_005750 [Tetracentron sinense]|uniref:F-box domain-containing protein n=1 Tax=Tetracentron sinense TaxID=13715 RepID=A0A834ZUU6_TETSI|nr:hypothetical protein HHK36_005750 [Tetracentron sinense]